MYKYSLYSSVYIARFFAPLFVLKYDKDNILTLPLFAHNEAGPTSVLLTTISCRCRLVKVFSPLSEEMTECYLSTACQDQCTLRKDSPQHGAPGRMSSSHPFLVCILGWCLMAESQVHLPADRDVAKGAAPVCCQSLTRGREKIQGRAKHPT